MTCHDPSDGEWDRLDDADSKEAAGGELMGTQVEESVGQIPNRRRPGTGTAPERCRAGTDHGVKENRAEAADGLVVADPPTAQPTVAHRSK